MSNLFRSWNNWFSVSSQTAMLALEAQSVIALRLMRIAAGGALARSETSRMVTEKVQALGEAQTVAAVESVTGRNRRHIAKKIALFIGSGFAETAGDQVTGNHECQVR
jgi:hypothetical protein